MIVALIGATGFVGTEILKELVSRGHSVTAIVRDTDKLPANEKVTAIAADAFDEAVVATAVKGNDAVISAYNAGWTNPNFYEDFMKASKAIEAGVAAAGIKRLIVVGGAGSLYVAPGVQLVDTPEFPAAYKVGATAARDYLDILKENKNLDWTFVSPAIELNPGAKTGTFRLGLENPVFDANNRSIITVGDLAVAIVEELEKSAHIKQRFTAAY